MSIFDFDDYLSFINRWLESQPKSGRGMKQKVAKHLGISSTLVSFLFAGSKSFTMEQASDLADFMALSEKEAQHFLLLVEIDRAGNHRLKARLEKKLKEEKDQAKKIKSRVKKDHNLSLEQSAIYYSSWLFTGIRNLAAVEEFQSAEKSPKDCKFPWRP